MSDNLHPDDSLFELLGEEPDDLESGRAPSRLKAGLYSALIQRQEESGALRSLGEMRNRGYGLCVFEDLWRRATSGEGAHCLNCCRFCHARVLAEHIENAPIFWGRCPYVELGKK
jgi:hypothetical protein